MANPAKFMAEVKKEGQRVVWPTRKETGLSTLMTFILASFMAVFFLLADGLISWIIGGIIGY